MPDSSPTPGFTRTEKIALVSSMLISLLVFVSMVVEQDLWFADETRVAGMVVQMADRQLYSVPYLGNAPFVEKPPLYHVSAAWVYALGGSAGNPTLSLRLASLAWGLMTLVVCYLLTAVLLRRDGSTGQSPAQVRLASLAAVAALLSMPGFICNAIMVRVDIALCFCYLAALLCLVQWVFTCRPAYLYGGALFTALAVLAKGIIGPVLIGASLLALSPEVLGSGKAHWREHGKHYLLAIGVLLAPVVAWLAMLYQHGGGELLSFWLIDNQLNRFQGGGGLWHEKPGNYGYYFRSLYEYLAVWVVFLLLWLGWCGRTLLRARRLPALDRQLLLFFLLPLAFLSIASTKRPIYLLPLLPVCAVAIGLFIYRLESPRLLLLARCLSLVCIGLVVVLSLLSLFAPRLDALEPYLEQLSATGGLLFVLGGIGLALLVPRLSSSWLTVAPAMSLLSLLLAHTYFPVVNAHHGQQQALQDFLAQVDDDQLAVSAGYTISDGLQGYLYAYTHRVIDGISASEVVAVLQGRDLRYRCVLLVGKFVHQLPAHKVIATMVPNEQIEGLRLLCRGQMAAQGPEG